jgi:hypothetical protein
VLALDRIEAVTDACDVREFDAGDAFPIGPFAIESRRLPHPAPNAGFRISSSVLKEAGVALRLRHRRQPATGAATAARTKIANCWRLGLTGPSWPALPCQM